MKESFGEQSGGDLNRKDILKVVALGVAAPTAWVTGMLVFYDSHPDVNPPVPKAEAHLLPNKKAKIISESMGSEYKDPSLLLRQTLADGRTVTIRKPVFSGEVAIHEPGDKVVPKDLEPPLPEQPYKP